MTASDLYREGRLNDAILAMNDEVRTHPTDVERRSFLCELLCLAGNLDRADAQLETVTAQQPAAGVGVSLVRQLIRGERARRDFHESGRAPEFLEKPSEEAQLRIRASILLREGELAEATQLLADAEERRPHPRGTVAGASFDDFRDLDDLLGGFLEVLTSTGKYYWISMDRVESLAVRKPERPLDLLWVPTELSATGGPEGVVYLPAVYTGPTPVEDEALLLGRATEWAGDDDQAVRGAGLRTFLVGDGDVPILHLGEMIFAKGDGEGS